MNQIDLISLLMALVVIAGAITLRNREALVFLRAKQRRSTRR